MTDLMIFWRGPIMPAVVDGRPMPTGDFEKWVSEDREAHPVLYRPKAWPKVAVGMFCDLEVADGALFASVVVSRLMLTKAIRRIEMGAVDLRLPLYPEADTDEHGPQALWLGYRPVWPGLQPVVDADTVAALWLGHRWVRHPTLGGGLCADCGVWVDSVAAELICGDPAAIPEVPRAGAGLRL